MRHIILLALVALSCACANSQLIRERNKNLQEIVNAMPLEKRNIDGGIAP